MRLQPSIVVALVAALSTLSAACASESAPDATVPGEQTSTPGAPAAPSPPPTDGTPAVTPPSEPPADGDCVFTATTADHALAAATGSGEHVLTIEARSTSKTSWAEKGNEAVVLEVLKSGARVGHFVLHQGQDRFAYAMHVGTLASGDALTVRVSPLTAKDADKSACIAKVSLAPPAADIAEGVAHAPILKWPIAKTFDDLPVLTGWSKAGKSYQVAYTNENGGTVAQCGGGARGVRSEIERWGRAVDMEGAFGYGGAGRFGRCTGSTPLAAGAPRMDALHPVLYYGDGHNRLFESRGGYGNECGSGGPEKADGALDGWNEANPGNEAAKDDPFTIVLRPVPVDMDAIGVAKYGGRREGIVDTYAPWLYRLVDGELTREKKIDGSQSLTMSRYLYVDVYAKDVGGSGDSNCSLGVSGGFKLRAIAKDGTVSSGPQMTLDYFGGAGNGVKRIAIPLAAGVTAKEITAFAFDAYDNDGIYFLGVGDAFVPQPSGTNGATLEYVVKGSKPANVYVDDANLGCIAGKNTKDGIAYPCAGSTYRLAL